MKSEGSRTNKCGTLTVDGFIAHRGHMTRRGVVLSKPVAVVVPADEPAAWPSVERDEDGALLYVLPGGARTRA